MSFCPTTCNVSWDAPLSRCRFEADADFGRRYSETFTMAVDLPGKEKQTKKTINHGLKNTFKKTRSNFFLFRSPAAEDTRKDVIRLSLSLSPRQLKRFNLIYIQRRRKNETHKRLLYIWQQATDWADRPISAQSLTCPQIDPALHCYYVSSKKKKGPRLVWIGAHDDTKLFIEGPPRTGSRFS